MTHAQARTYSGHLRLPCSPSTTLDGQRTYFARTKKLAHNCACYIRTIRHALEHFHSLPSLKSFLLATFQVDGMDNSKSYLPRFLEKTKENQGTERLPSKISGCIIYSGFYELKRKTLFFINHDQVFKYSFAYGSFFKSFYISFLFIF